MRPRLLLLLVLSLGGCTTASRDTVLIPVQQVPGSRMPSQPLSAIMLLPPGKGPFPAIIVLHTCGGRSLLQEDWAARLNAWGYAAVIPNSFTPRGVVSVCSPVN